MNTPQHRVELRPLTNDEGGGWLASFPDLPGCMSDGETPEEALHNAAEAESAWLAANVQWSEKRPQKPARLVARLPRSVHRDLQARAQEEGVSINTMMVTLLARGLAHQSGKEVPSGRLDVQAHS